MAPNSKIIRSRETCYMSFIKSKEWRLKTLSILSLLVTLANSKWTYISNNQASIDGIIVPTYHIIPTILLQSCGKYGGCGMRGTPNFKISKSSTNLWEKNSKSAKVAGTTGFLPYQIQTMLVYVVFHKSY